MDYVYMHVRDKHAHTKKSKINISKTIDIATKRQHTHNMALNCMRQKKVNEPATGGKFDWKVLVIASVFFFDMCNALCLPYITTSSPNPFLFIYIRVRACVCAHANLHMRITWRPLHWNSIKRYLAQAINIAQAGISRVRKTTQIRINLRRLGTRAIT
jgi:hypothetical protein